MNNLKVISDSKPFPWVPVIAAVFLIGIAVAFITNRSRVAETRQLSSAFLQEQESQKAAQLRDTNNRVKLEVIERDLAAGRITATEAQRERDRILGSAAK